jgi:16S rRNA (cytosine1402-N4)-methyltransferase
MSAPGHISAQGHIPVMLAEVLEHLAPAPGEIHLDGTFGGGGYARAILQRGATLYAIDRDPAAIARGEALAETVAGRLHMMQGGFGDMQMLLADRGVTRLDGIVLDLGISSFQIDDPDRGFSFRFDGPLDMRMGRDGTSAADLVAALPESELADTLYRYGEERASRRIARAIVQARTETPIRTTLQLADIVRSVMPKDRSGIDPATRSFQALRIRVNDELGQIERALAASLGLLAPGGRLVVVSFHSLEDRIVKQFVTDATGRAPAPSRHDPAGLIARKASEFRMLTPRAVRPSDAESATNPRARSARLRAMQKLAEAA